MTITELLGHLGLWSIIGCALFSVFVIVVFRTGVVWSARSESGLLKEQIPPRGYLSMLTIPLGIVVLQVSSNALGPELKPIELDFLHLFLLNFGYYVILFLYDTLVIDVLVLSVWRPGFLKLPDAIGWQSMQRHIVLSIPAGAVIGLALTAISTAISQLIFLNR